jgi:hypothetical protein
MAYHNFTKGNFDIQAGLRAEYINYNATSHNKDNYLSLFPSVLTKFQNDQFNFHTAAVFKDRVTCTWILILNILIPTTYL